jgi:phosphatidylglycerol---prolipoprotein diacylglyceryl transferase
MESLFTQAVAALGEQGPGWLWCLALVAGVAWAVRSAERAGLDPRAAYVTSLVALGAGLCGSRLLGLAVYPIERPITFWGLVLGGHAFLGGLLAGTAAAVAWLRMRGLPVLAYADAFAPACALGYAVGRLGCFLNGCDYGIPLGGPLSVRYPHLTEPFAAQVRAGLLSPSSPLSLPVLPVQLLHACLGALLFLLLQRPAAAPGRRLALLLLGYGVGRFLLELVRGDFVPAVGPLSLHQAIGLGLTAAGAALLLGPRLGPAGAPPEKEPV